MASLIERKLDNALTVGELIEELRQYPRDAKVVFACDYGDICHTTQALPIETCDEMDDSSERIEETAYSYSGLEIAQRDFDPEDDEDMDDSGNEFSQIVVLR